VLDTLKVGTPGVIPARQLGGLGWALAIDIAKYSAVVRSSVFLMARSVSAHEPFVCASGYAFDEMEIGPRGALTRKKLSTLTAWWMMIDGGVYV